MMNLIFVSSPCEQASINGFSLTELLVVVTLIAVLAIFSYPVIVPVNNRLTHDVIVRQLLNCNQRVLVQIARNNNPTTTHCDAEQNHLVAVAIEINTTPTTRCAEWLKTHCYTITATRLNSNSDDRVSMCYSYHYSHLGLLTIKNRDGFDVTDRCSSN